MRARQLRWPGRTETTKLRAISRYEESPMLRLTAMAAALCSRVVRWRRKRSRPATVLIMEKPAGVQTNTVAADGSRNLELRIQRSRPRPETHGKRVRLDSASVPMSIEMDGVDYLKAPVSERFTFANGAARWKNGAEAGEQKLGGSSVLPEHAGLSRRAGLAGASACCKRRDSAWRCCPQARRASSAPTI